MEASASHTSPPQTVVAPRGGREETEHSDKLTSSKIAIFFLETLRTRSSYDNNPIRNYIHYSTNRPQPLHQNTHPRSHHDKNSDDMAFHRDRENHQTTAPRRIFVRCKFKSAKLKGRRASEVVV